jgi:hypothetical protein
MRPNIASQYWCDIGIQSSINDREKISCFTLSSVHVHVDGYSQSHLQSWRRHSPRFLWKHRLKSANSLGSDTVVLTTILALFQYGLIDWEKFYYCPRAVLVGSEWAIFEYNEKRGCLPCGTWTC